MHCYQHKVIAIILFIIVTINTIIITNSLWIVDQHTGCTEFYSSDDDLRFSWCFFSASIFLTRKMIVTMMVIFIFIMTGRPALSLTRYPSHPCLLPIQCNLPPKHQCTITLHGHKTGSLHCIYSDCSSKFKLNPLLSALISAQLRTCKISHSFVVQCSSPES